MYPHLLNVPVWIVAALLGGAVCGTLVGQRKLLIALAAIVGVVVVGLVVRSLSFGNENLPVQSYGVAMLTGFLVAVWTCQRRMPAIGVAPHHVLDMGVIGVIVGLCGARLFHVLMNWADYNPWADGHFDVNQIKRILALWEGGLVFYGAMLTAIPFCYFYGRKYKLPALAFTDILGPGMLLGLAFGRIGCFMTGCCFGKQCSLPWAVQFPAGSPAFETQSKLGLLGPLAAHSLPVHPTQLYSSLAAFLAYAFIYAYWPRRQYDGQCLALAFILAGATRFFEEALRLDDVPAFPSISTSMTIAQWFAIPIVLMGFGLLFYFRRRNVLTTVTA